MKKRILREEPAGRDRWIVSYADFITVLLAFFVVMFASLTQNGHSIKSVSQAIHVGFVALQPFPDNSIALRTLRSSAADEHDLQLPPSDLPGFDLQGLRRELESAIGVDLRNGDVTMQTTPEGFVISLKELGFFRSGDAKLEPGAGTKIERIAKVMGEHGFTLRIEGHSDNEPIHNAQFESNWQLSTARATTVLMFLVGHSELNPGKLSLAGYGQYRPVASNATPEGRRLNRRVDIVVAFRQPKARSNNVHSHTISRLDE